MILEENSSFPILSEANVFLKSAATGLAASVTCSEGRIDDLFSVERVFRAFAAGGDFP